MSLPERRVSRQGDKCTAYPGSFGTQVHWENEMKNLIKSTVNFLKREDGPTAVEYAVMLALIVVVCIAAITAIGSSANTTFSKVGSAVQGS